MTPVVLVYFYGYIRTRNVLFPGPPCPFLVCTISSTCIPKMVVCLVFLHLGRYLKKIRACSYLVRSCCCFFQPVIANNNSILRTTLLVVEKEKGDGINRRLQRRPHTAAAAAAEFRQMSGMSCEGIVFTTRAKLSLYRSCCHSSPLGSSLYLRP